jgi:transposase-like protein
MPKFIISRIILAASLLVLAGCVSSGVKVDQSKLLNLHKGETTYAEATKLLGKPSSVSVNENGDKTAIYMYYSSQARPETFIPYVGAFVGGADSESTMTMLQFDGNDILQHYSSNQGAMGTGTGLEAYSQARTAVNGN